MSASRRDLNRLVALGSAAAVIAIPIALVASTWQPLAPVPRGGAQDMSEPDDGPTEESPTRNRRGRQDRDGKGDSPSATPSE